MNVDRNCTDSKTVGSHLEAYISELGINIAICMYVSMTHSILPIYFAVSYMVLNNSNNVTLYNRVHVSHPRINETPAMWISLHT